MDLNEKGRKRPFEDPSCIKPLSKKKKGLVHSIKRRRNEGPAVDKGHVQNRRRKMKLHYQYPNVCEVKPKIRRKSILNNAISKDKGPQSSTIDLNRTDVNSSSVEDENRDSRLINDEGCDLFCIDEVKCNYETSKRIDFCEFLIDEVALEGLDGITLQGLWTRLSTRLNTPELSTTFKEQCWRFLVNNKHMDFFVLPEEREPLRPIDSNEDYTIFNNNSLYPFCPVNDELPIRGSCSTFSHRTRMNPNEYSSLGIEREFGRKLVICATQKIREKALICRRSDPTFTFTVPEYCLLERIGRSRYCGESCNEPGGGTTEKSGQLKHYYRKMFTKSFLTSTQTIYRETDRHLNTSVVLIQLQRFFNKRKSRRQRIMEDIAALLKNAPKFEVPFSQISALYRDNVAFPSTTKYTLFHQFFNSVLVPYRHVYPEATEGEWRRKGSKDEKSIRVLRLIDPYVNIGALVEDSKDVDLPQNTTSVEKNLEPPQKRLFVDSIRDIYLYIHECHKEGATLNEVFDHLGTEYYLTRSVIMKLHQNGYLTTTRLDRGRQTVLKYKVASTKDNYKPINIVQQPTKHSFPSDLLKKLTKTNREQYVEQDLVRNFDEPIDYEEVFKINEEFVLQINPHLLLLQCQVLSGPDEELLLKSNLKIPKLKVEDLKQYQFGSESQWGFYFGVLKQFVINYSELWNDLNQIRIVDDLELKLCVNDSMELIETKWKRCQISTMYIFQLFLQCLPIRDGFQIQDYLNSIVDLFQIDNNKSTGVLPDTSQQKKISTCNLTNAKDVTESESEDSSDDNPIMDIYMGSNPTRLMNCLDVDGIRIQMYESSKPVDNRIPFEELLANVANESNERFVRRLQMIVDIVDRCQSSVEDMILVYREIVQRERDENSSGSTLCRKSLKKLLGQLVKNGYLKIFKIVLTSVQNNYTQYINLVCKPDISYDDPGVTTHIEKIKAKLYIMPKQRKWPIKNETLEVSPFDLNEVRNSINSLKLYYSQRPNRMYSPFKYNQNFGRSIGYQPKFQRSRIFHEFLYYLIFENGQEPKPSNMSLLGFREQLQNELSNSTFDQNHRTSSNVPEVYTTSVSWKMFIPPLPVHQGWTRRWLLVCDILLRLPLSTFVQIFNLTHELPEIRTYCAHPIRKHFLLKDLPQHLRLHLFHWWKCMTALHDLISHLCYLGLVQLGPQKYRKRSELFIYFNRKASLIDTSSAAPSYHQVALANYPVLRFEFTSMRIIQNYWQEMYRICAQTPLGRRSTVQGQTITFEHYSIRPELLQVLQSRSVEAAPAHDTGTIPGNHRGAAGLDSSLWSYLKRNWLWSPHSDSTATPTPPTSSNVHKSKVKYTTINPALRYRQMDRRKVYKILSNNNNSRLVNSGGGSMIPSSRKLVTRKILDGFDRGLSKKRPNKIDRLIIAKNARCRYVWSEAEDHVLRLSIVLSKFLYRKQHQSRNGRDRRIYVSSIVIRDFIHAMWSKSRTKTSCGCRRRLTFLHKKYQKEFNGNLHVLLQIDVIEKVFAWIYHQPNRVKLTDNQSQIAYLYLMSYFVNNPNLLKRIFHKNYTDLGVYPFEWRNLSDLREKIVEKTTDSVLIYEQPLNESKIEEDCIKSIIHCSLNCTVWIGWACQLFSIYKKYSNERIKEAVLALRNQHVLTAKKRHQNINTAWQVPFKLSERYKFKLHNPTYNLNDFQQSFHTVNTLLIDNSNGSRRKSTLTNHQIGLNEVRTTYQDFDYKFDVPSIGLVLNPNQDNHSEIIERLACEYRNYLQSEYDKVQVERSRLNIESSTESKTNETILDAKQLKDVVMKLIFRVPYLIEDRLDQLYRQFIDEVDDSNLETLIRCILDELLKFITASNVSSSKIDDFTSDLLTISATSQWDLLMQLIKAIFTIQNIHSSTYEQFTKERFEEFKNHYCTSLIELKRDSTKGGDDRKVSNFDKSIRKTISSDEIPTLEEIKIGMLLNDEDNSSSTQRRIPHIADLLHFFYNNCCLNNVNEKFDEFKGHFIMQLPTLQEFKINNMEDFKEQIIESNLDENKSSQSFNTSIFSNLNTEPDCTKALNEFIQRGQTDLVESVEFLIEFIASKQSIGATILDIQNVTSLDDSTVLNVLECLCANSILLRIGITEFVFVHYRHYGKWLAETFRLSSEESAILAASDSKHEPCRTELTALRTCNLDREYYRARLVPWSKLDGTQNRDLYEKWLSLVLSYCLERPAIQFFDLCAHFCYVKPVDLFSLVEVLENCSSVEIWTYSKQECGLFSEYNTVYERRATCLDRFEDIFIETNNKSVLRLGRFLTRDKH